MKQHHPKLNLKLMVCLLGMAGMALNAQALASSNKSFITDTSNQRVVMIGSGGYENMQRIQVQDIRSNISHAPTVPPAVVQTQTTTSIQPVNQYQNTQYPPQNYGYNQNSQYYGNQNYNSQYGQQGQYITQHSTPSNASYVPQSLAPFSASTSAAAAVVYDLKTGQLLYQKNADIRRSIASITKMITAMVVIDSGQDMYDELVISNFDLMGAKNASTRLLVGDRMSRSQFLLMMLMKSENPAAKTLASHYYGGYDAFISAMNQKAQSLGMTNTYFQDASGLDPRNVSSANDLVKMMREVATNPRYQTIRNFSTAKNYDFNVVNYDYGNRVYSASNTNRLVRDGYPISASKTGFIRESRRSVVMEADVNGNPAIIVLLGSDTTEKRDRDAQNILLQLAYR